MSDLDNSHQTSQSEQHPSQPRSPSGTTPPTSEPPIVVGFSGWSAPLPPPDLLAAYDHVQPGLAATLVHIMVEEAEDRRKYRWEVTHADIDETRADRRERRLGQHYALVIGIVAILIGTTAACRGHDLTGSLIGGGGVVGLVAVFIQGRASVGRPRYTSLPEKTPPDQDRPG
jgi:uncharacterized membrane protein